MTEVSEYTVATARGDVSARRYAADGQGAGVTLLLAHGAGAGQHHPFMVAFASGLTERGIDVVTFNFPYMEQRRRAPDPAPALEQCYAAVIAASRRTREGKRFAIGGKSMGGRIASHIAAAWKDDPAPCGLVLLGYPLHPPGQPGRLRTAHLPGIQVPTLIVQGSRDDFGTPEELRTHFSAVPTAVTLHVVEGGDHSFKVGRASSTPQQQVFDTVQDVIASWLASVC